MPNAEQVKILKQGVEVWNLWRKQKPEVQIDLSNCDLTDMFLQGVDLEGSFCYETNFTNADLTGADLSFGSYWHAIFDNANLTRGRLTRAKLGHIEADGATFSHAYLRGADFEGANVPNSKFVDAVLFDAHCARATFTHADFTRADLTRANFVEANLHDTILTNCKVYGVSIWMVRGTPKDQSDLVITHPYFAAITVDNIHLAQFIHLLLTNDLVANVIDTLTSKVVLILGRFSDERKAVLDSIRDELRQMNFTPILFDFEKPTSKDLTGTVSTLANMARFIIADLTDPSSIPYELATIVPHIPTTPVLSIKLKASDNTFDMFKDLRTRYPGWVLPTHEYLDGPSLIAELSEVIKPANDMAEGFRNRG